MFLYWGYKADFLSVICILRDIGGIDFFIVFDVDISELNLPKTCNMSFPNGKDDLMNFDVSIRPDEGYYL